ncbi:hypothetical protein Tco_0616520 [Tanacetum coccineum]
MRITSSHRLFVSQVASRSGFSDTKTYQVESDQKDKMRHAMDDNGSIPSKEIQKDIYERAITAEEVPDDTGKPPPYVPLISNGMMNRGTELALIPKV